MFNEAPVRPSIHAKGRQASAIPAKTKRPHAGQRRWPRSRMKMVTTQLTWVALALNVTMRSATAKLRALLLRLTVKVPSSTLISTFLPLEVAFGMKPAF